MCHLVLENNALCEPGEITSPSRPWFFLSVNPGSGLDDYYPISLKIIEVAIE